MTTLFLTVFCFLRLILINQRENISLYVDNGTLTVVLAMAAIFISLFFYLFGKRKNWLSYSIDVFMLVGGGVFFWELTDWESDILLWTGVAIFLIIIACAISILRFFNRSDLSYASSTEKIEINYFFTHEIWAKIFVFISIFVLIESFLVPLVA